MTGVSRKEEARRWFLQALYDFKAAEWNLNGGFYNTVCFLAQQAAEKGLKSVVYYSGISRKKVISHSVVELLTTVETIIPEVKTLINEARELDLHYIPSRYPNGLPSGFPHSFYGIETGRKAIDSAKKILDAIDSYYRNQKFEVSIEEQ